MKCVQCNNEVQNNAGTDDNPLCASCYDRMKLEHPADSKLKNKSQNPKWVLPIVIALLLITSGFVGLYYFAHTPAFAFKSIVLAIENHDWDKFNKFVDVESFYNTTVKGALNETDNLFAKGLGTLMASNMKESFIDQLKTQIEQPNENSISFFHQLFDNKNILLARKKVESKGKIVQVTIPRKTQYLDLEIPIIFNFRKEALHLTLTSMDMNKFENVQDKIEEIITEHYNLPIKDSLKNLVKIEVVKKYKGCSNYVYNTCIEDVIIITTRVTNKSNFTIERVIFAVLPKLYNCNWKGTKFQQAENIKPGKSVIVGVNHGWKYNEYNDYDKIYMKTTKADIHYQTKEVWRKIKIGPFDMTMPLKEEEFKYYKERIEKDKLTLEDIIARRNEYGLDDSLAINTFLLNKDDGV